MRLRILPFYMALLLTGSAMGQHKSKNKNKGNDLEGPHKDLYLPVECLVTANGGPTDNVTVTVYKDNEVAFELSPEKNKSAFLLELDMDCSYTVLVSKEGYRNKTVFIDSHLPEDQTKYKSTSFAVDLDGADKFAHGDQFYLDFPSAIIQWDGQKQTFVHNENYVANIQLKMALLGAQVETQ